MENLGLGLTLMAIGMVTVFAILLIVINLSNVLIKIVNKVCPEEEAPKKKAAPAAAPAKIDARNGRNQGYCSSDYRWKGYSNKRNKSLTFFVMPDVVLAEDVRWKDNNKSQ